MINRREEIKAKGFAMSNLSNDTKGAPYQESFRSTDFSRIRVGPKILDDAVFEYSSLKKVNPRLMDKETVLRAIDNCNFAEMREISNFFYRTSGIYSRLCRYMAYLYRYDWLVTPYIQNTDKYNEEKVLSDFNKILYFFDELQVKRILGEIALQVIRDGCYYGYIIHKGDKVDIQDLPANYCRSRFSVNGRPAVEFNMKFFDDSFRDTEQKIRILNLFPAEFKKGYRLYKEGKLVPDFMGDTSGWYLLEFENVIKFNINGEDFPAFVSVIPAIIDLDEAQALDRKKMAQKLLKIIVQKMPMDKNGDLIFDVDEAAQLHNNAVNMLSKAIGIDVLTTFADVSVEDMADKNTTTTVDDLNKVERTVYNEAGVSQMQFNTDGNIALEKSILNDEASMYNLIVQFEAFLNMLLKSYNTNPKKVLYRIQLLTTTIYNYKEMAKLYKEQTQLGYSKMLPQIALGQSQSSILANAFFENDVLDLVNVFVPPMMSSTMNADAIAAIKNKDGNNPEGGRPTKESNGESVSEKTMQNKESAN